MSLACYNGFREMKLVVGLGNPGKKFDKTRHNVGFVIVDALASEISNSQVPISNQIQNSNFQKSKNANADYLNLKLGDKRIELVKPLTFMNESGISVAYAKNKHKIPLADIYVIHDDLDIKLGEYKIQKGKGPRDHNGLNSVYERLGGKDFWHVRIGVDNREPGNRIAGEDYVLQGFTDHEIEVVRGVTEKVCSELLVRLGLKG